MPHFVLAENKKNWKIFRQFLLAASIIMIGWLAVHAAEEKVEPLPAPDSQKQEKVKATPEGQEQETITEPKEIVIKKNIIYSTNAHRVENNLEITILCATPPNYNDHKMPVKSSIRIDIADAEINKQANLELPEVFNIDLSSKAITNTTPEVIQFDFSLPRPYVTYKTTLKENAIILLIEDFFKGQEEEEKTLPPTDDAALEKPIESQLPEVDPPAIGGLEPDGTESTSKGGLSESFGSSG
ncbi:MAG: hypothetical protein D3923_15570, partial [Candidatus Electrothrix sp. AR3]|nr:hypothetical protein [Candidatus Electrothrix sp. AR3]